MNPARSILLLRAGPVSLRINNQWYAGVIDRDRYGWRFLPYGHPPAYRLNPVEGGGIRLNPGAYSIQEIVEVRCVTKSSSGAARARSRQRGACAEGRSDVVVG